MELTFGEKIRLLRENKELNQTQLGAAVNMTQRKISYIENDKYDYKAKCEMNKYTATDNISIVIIFDGKPIRIELSK